MPLISNGIKSKKVGKSGLDNRIYQPFYSFLEHFKKYAEINTEKVSLSTGPNNLLSTGKIQCCFRRGYPFLDIPQM